MGGYETGALIALGAAGVLMLYRLDQIATVQVEGDLARRKLGEEARP